MRIQFSIGAGIQPNPLSAGVLPSLTWTLPAVSTIAVASLLVAGSTAYAHHSARAFFDTGNMGEIEGEVTGTHWRNPHVEFQVQVTGEDGAQETWTIESNSVNALERIGITSDMIEVGDRVVFWGAMSRLGRPSMRGYNVLLSSGEEVLMMPHISTERRWDDRDLLATVPVLQDRDTSAAIERADGIFRVWTPGRIRTVSHSELPLSEEGAARRADYDPLTDDPVLNCVPTGMPAVMDVTFPIEFTREGNDIVMRLEQWDTVRTIHMDGSPGDAAGRPATREGYSVGRWQDGALVIETSNIDWLFFDDRGTPLSSAVSVVEQITLSDDEQSLHWRATTTDPVMFTEPVVQEQTFTWVPGEEIRPYECATAN